MKNIAKLSIILLVFVLTSCKDNNTNNQSDANTDTVKTEQSQSADKMYACPMHPEVTGKQGEKCSKCGMDLTEEVK
jgi:hypothetical protein